MSITVARDSDVSAPALAPQSPAASAVPIRAVVIAGLSVAFIVCRDGSLAWQVLRFLVVVGATMLLLRGVTSSRRVAAPLAFAAGVVALAIGVGIGVPHLAKAGVHDLTVAGLLCAASAIVLVVCAGADLVRRVHSWRRPIAALGLLALAALSMWTFAPPIAATNVPPISSDSTTPADVGLPYADIELVAADGVGLSGWYVGSTNGAAVVLLHGAGSTRASVLDHAVVLARNGYGVLLLDARGHGRSGGQAMDFGWYGDEDVAAAVAFLERQSDVADGRIAAVGMSMGGEEAIGAAAADLRLLAVVAEGATKRVAADAAWLSDVHGWRGAIQEVLERVQYGVTDLLTAADAPMALRDAVAAAAPRPVLLIAAGNVADEADAGRYIRSASPGSVELWIAEGAGHTDALEVHPDEWEARVVGFLDTALEVRR